MTISGLDLLSQLEYRRRSLELKFWKRMRGCSLQPHGEASINLQHQKHLMFDNNSSTHTNLSFIIIRSNSASLPSAQKVPRFALFLGSCCTGQRCFSLTAWVPSSLPCRIPASLPFEIVLSVGQNRGCLPRLC